jgi:hypothetical protein
MLLPWLNDNRYVPAQHVTMGASGVHKRDLGIVGAPGDGHTEIQSGPLGATSTTVALCTMLFHLSY